MGQNLLDTDDFGGSSGTDLETYSANWVKDTTDGLEISATANTIVQVASGSHGTYHRTGQTWTDDHWAQFTINGASDDVEVWIRLKGDGTRTGYMARYYVGDSAGIYLLKRVNNGTETILTSSATTFLAGDVMNFQVVGTVLTFVLNGNFGSPLLTWNTATVPDAIQYSTGYPGISGYSVPQHLMGGTWRAGSVTADEGATVTWVGYIG